MNIAYIIQRGLNNFWYKFASLILALVIWGIVQGEEVVEFSQRIRFEVSVGPNYLVKGGPYHFLDAQIRGPRVLVGDGMLKPIEARYLVNPGEVGKLEIPFDMKYLKGTWDNRIKIKLSNPYITVYVDEKATRNIPIREVVRGTPNESYIIEKIDLKPRSVKVTWLKSELARITEIVTEPIDVTDLQKSKTMDALLVPRDIPDDALETNLVQVNIRVGDVRTNKTFFGIPVDLIGIDTKARAKPAVANVVLQGIPDVLEKIDPKSIKVFAELDGLKVGKHSRKVQARIPSETTLIEIRPENVLVTIDPK